MDGVNEEAAKAVDMTNPAETVRDLMENLGSVERVDVPDSAAFGVAEPDQPVLISVPRGREVIDASKFFGDRMRPERRKGTMTAQSLKALIDWTNRFKGDNSMLFLDRRQETLSLTTIANYHREGAPDIDMSIGDMTAEWGDHRAVYKFPLSREWKTWTGKNKQPMSVEDFGTFIDDNIRDLLDPTAALSGVGEPASNWERVAMEVAEKLGGRFAEVHQLISLSKDFRIFSTEKTQVTHDKTSGQAQIAFSEDHTDESGKPLKLPNLFLIKIPVFDRGAVYPLVVRFMYRKAGPKLFYEIYDPARAIDDAIDQVAEQAEFDTELSIMDGLPETA
jgi:uncharacterized protein YfdQ (DUF2303 family)